MVSFEPPGIVGIVDGTGMIARQSKITRCSVLTLNVPDDFESSKPMDFYALVCHRDSLTMFPSSIPEMTLFFGREQPVCGVVALVSEQICGPTLRGGECNAVTFHVLNHFESS